MASKTSKTAEAKPKRKRSTQAERIAELEAKLEQAKAREQERSAKTINQLLGRRDNISKRLETITAQYDELNAKLEALGHVDEVKVEVEED